MGDQTILMTAPTAAACAAAKVLNPAQQKQLEKFGRRINRLGANFAVCSEEGDLLVLCEEGGFKSSRKHLAELAHQVLEGPSSDPSGPVSILKFGGATVVLAGLLDLMVPGQAHFKGTAVVLIDLGEDGVHSDLDRWSSIPVDLSHRRIYLSEMLASLIECFQGVAKAEQQMELVGSELSHVYEELVLLHKLSTHMKLTESDGGFLQMVCDSLTEVSPVEGIAILLDRVSTASGRWPSWPGPALSIGMSRRQALDQAAGP